MRGIAKVKHEDMMSALELPPAADIYPVEMPEVIYPSTMPMTKQHRQKWHSQVLGSICVVVPNAGLDRTSALNQSTNLQQANS